MNEAERLVELIPRLRRYARALVGDRASADDLVQDTLERAWAKLHLYRRGTDLRAWLFTVMHNVHVNKVRATRVTDTLEDELPELAQRASQGDALLVRDLDRAIARLPRGGGRGPPPPAGGGPRCALLPTRGPPSRFRNISKARRHVARVLAGSPLSPAG